MPQPLEAACRCGETVLRIHGEPLVQLYCHCDDCQAAHAAAYVPAAIFHAEAVQVSEGNLRATVVRTTPRMHCHAYGTYLFAEIADHGLRSLSAYLLPKGMFRPQFHVQCQYALLPVVDALPHYKGFPAGFGGAETFVEW